MYLLFVASLLLPNAQGHESRGIPTEHKKIVTKPTVGSWSTGSDRFGWIGKSNMSHKIVYYFFPCSPHGVLWLGTTTKAQENSMCSHFGTVVYKQDTRNSQYILYVSDLIADAPWAELVAFLNALVKTENQMKSQSQAQTPSIDALLASNVFPADGERGDELPLPEDYLVRGLIWADGYFPKTWFEREHDEEERYLELASTVKNRMERVLRLGYSIAKQQRWITYTQDSHTFSVRSQ